MASQPSELYGPLPKSTDGRRALPTERKTYNIKNMWQRHHEIVNLAALGYKQVEIAKILNIEPQTVSNTLNAELGKEKLGELREIRDGETKLRLEQIRVLTDRALATYHEIFDNENGEATLKERKEVADTVLLELSGLRVAQKQINANVSLTPEDFAEFKARGIAAMREAGLVVDVEPEEVPSNESNNSQEKIS